MVVRKCEENDKDALPECFKPKKKTMKFEENFVEPKNGFK